MADQDKAPSVLDAEPLEPAWVLEERAAEERKGMRGHDERGNVRPADDRYELHEPAEESVYCGPAAPATEAATETPDRAESATPARSGRGKQKGATP